MLAFRPAAEVQQRWQPLMDYLNGKLPGYSFQLKSLGYDELENAISQHSIDFVFTNPAHYILMTYRNGLSSPLVTLVTHEHGRTLDKFGGVIIARADRADIRVLEDLRGQTVAAVTTGSLGGYQAQAAELLSQGIDLKTIDIIETGMPHDRVVDSVLSGRAEAGFVRTSVLEEMAAEGKIDLTRIKVIARKKKADFPLLLSTQLYPEWPFSAMPEVDKELARQVTAAMLSFPHNSELSRKLGIHGFTIPTDYEAVRTTLETLRLPPFDAIPQFTAKDIWEKYQWLLLGAIFIISLVLLVAIWLIFLNTRLAESRRRIQLGAHKWQHLLNALGEGVFGVDVEGRCTFVNPAGLAMLGYSLEEMLGQDQHNLFHYQHEDGSPHAYAECPITLTLQDGVSRNLEDWFWRKDGTGFPVMMTTTPMDKKDRLQGAVVVFRDINKQRQLENQLRKEASTDPLTGVANRRLFLNQANQEIRRYQRFGEPASLIMADIDHFKRINDTYGHAVGDEVLKHFTKLTSEFLRSTDLLGRLGGEEFGILLSVTNSSDALVFAERCRRLVSETPAATAKGTIPFTVSLGLTQFHHSDETADNILKRADAALYRAKQGGRNMVEVFLQDRDAELIEPEGRSFIHLRWRNQYASGEETIDAEHRELIRLANSLLEKAALPNVTLKDFESAFDTVFSHVVTHFTHEEIILHEHDYDHLDLHVKRHRELIEKSKRLRRELDEEGLDYNILVNFLVSEVIAGHMLREDRKFYDLFKQKNPTSETAPGAADTLGQH